MPAERTETRHIEWKVTPPFGPEVTISIKYRVVKAVLAFANTEGGFIVFGVDSKGKWIGFDREVIDATDPAMLTELINGCVLPEITGLSYTVVKHAARWFGILHTPPSEVMPHVTTKEVVENLADGRKIRLNKGAVYCRYGAKCDLATAAQYNRMIERRTEYLKSEMLRRIKEIEVPSVKPFQRAVASPILRVTTTSNTGTTTVRVTRNRADAEGLLVYEELDAGLFDSINNVLETNNLLSRNKDFIFGEEIYYRVYAEREHVSESSEQAARLSRVAIAKFYAPVCFWLLKLSPETVANVLQIVPLDSKSHNVRIVCRLAIILGQATSLWASEGLHRAWYGHAQPPNHYFTGKDIAQIPDEDRLLTALQLSRRANVELTGKSGTIPVAELLDRPRETATLLSRACILVFDGQRDVKQECRMLDALAYGPDLAGRGADVAKFLPKQGRV
jgi:hypothetical protein